MFQKNTKAENLAKEDLFSNLNAIIDKSRTQVTAWVQEAGIQQIEFIIRELDSLLPTLIPYAADNFRWRINNKDSESLLYSKSLIYTGITNLPDHKPKQITGNVSVTAVVKPDNTRLLKIEVSGESSFLRGYEELGGKCCSNPDLCNAIWNRDYESNYGIYPISFFMNSDRFGITFEVKLNG